MTNPKLSKIEIINAGERIAFRLVYDRKSEMREKSIIIIDRNFNWSGVDDLDYTDVLHICLGRNSNIGIIEWMDKILSNLTAAEKSRLPEWFWNSYFINIVLKDRSELW